MGPIQSITTGIARSLQFSGRATRSEFLWFAGFIFVASLVLAWLDYQLFTAKVYSGRTGELIALYSNNEAGVFGGLVLLVSLVALCRRRSGQLLLSGLWALATAAVSLVTLYLVWSGQLSGSREVIDLRFTQENTIRQSVIGYIACIVATNLPTAIPFWRYAGSDVSQFTPNEVPS